MTVDERIEDFGFKLVSYNDTTGIFTYENHDNNQRVWLLVTKPYGAETSGVLYTETISTHENRTMAIGLSLAECRAFLDKADETLFKRYGFESRNYFLFVSSNQLAGVCLIIIAMGTRLIMRTTKQKGDQEV